MKFNDEELKLIEVEEIYYLPSIEGIIDNINNRNYGSAKDNLFILIISVQGKKLKTCLTEIARCFDKRGDIGRSELLLKGIRDDILENILKKITNTEEMELYRTKYKKELINSHRIIMTYGQEKIREYIYEGN